MLKEANVVSAGLAVAAVICYMLYMHSMELGWLIAGFVMIIGIFVAQLYASYKLDVHNNDILSQRVTSQMNQYDSVLDHNSDK